MAECSKGFRAMPIEKTWRTPNQVLGLRFWGKVTTDDLAVMDHSVIQTLDEATASPIHIISHELDLKEEPSITAYLQLKTPRHPRFGWYVVVQPRSNALGRFVTHIVCNAFKIKFLSVESEAQAWSFLRHIDPAIKSPESTVSPEAVR